jgi:NAD dependent epimerase/dehydratase family enzyme
MQIRAVNRPTIFPVPEPIAKIVFGQMGEEMLLGGQKVVPRKLEKAGFKFEFDDIDAATSSVIQ